MHSFLEVKNLSVKRGAEFVIDSLSTSFMMHQITGITGPNGGGKTSFFECLVDLLPMASGSLQWSKKPEIAFLAQQLLPRKILPLTVGDFIHMGTWGVKKSTTAAFDPPEIMALLELESISTQLISELSGGQWRRALLARCLVQPADLYLLDEPFNQLDLQMESRVGAILQDLSRNKQKTFFVISHDWHAMDHYFDRLLLMNKKIVVEGSVREVSDFYMNWAKPGHHQWMHPS